MAVAIHRVPLGELAVGGLEASQDRYLARSRTHGPGSYFELSVSPWGHVRCTCPGFTYRGICKHAEALMSGLPLLSFP
jgi:uncharacterized Zn finger protein